MEVENQNEEQVGGCEPNLLEGSSVDEYEDWVLYCKRLKLLLEKATVWTTSLCELNLVFVWC